MTGVGTNIAANDYNIIQNLIGNLLANVYGQSVQSVQVATTGTITAQQWQALLTDITAVNYHQLNAGPTYNGLPLTIPSNGSTNSIMIGGITYTNAVPAVKIKDQDRAQYLAVATALTSQTSTTVGGVTYPGCYAISGNVNEQTQIAAGSFPNGSSTRVGSTNPWGSTAGGSQVIALGQQPAEEGYINMVVTMTFPSANAANYYFNTGGSIVLSGTASAGQTLVNSTKDQSWAVLLSNMGNVVFNYFNTTGDSAGGTGYGWSYFSANPNISQLIYSINTTSQLYAPNKLTIYCALNSAGTTLTFTMALQDLSTAATKTASGASPGDSTLYSIDTPVTATITGNITIWYASGSYVTASQYLPSAVITTPLTA